MATAQYGILNDIHFPYESPAYYKALKLMEKWPNLRHLYLNGDIGEFEAVSLHAKRYDSNTHLMTEIDYINKKFDHIERLWPKLPVTLVCGNHSYRFFRYIRDVAPALWGVTDCPTLLKFPERKSWKFVDYGPTQWVKCGRTSDLWLRHEPPAGGANHAKASAEKSYVSVCYGHTHVYQQYTHKKMGPNPFLTTATSCGWLGDITKPVFDYRGSKDNWVTGFTRIDCDEKTGEYELRFIRL